MAKAAALQEAGSSVDWSCRRYEAWVRRLRRGAMLWCASGVLGVAVAQVATAPGAGAATQIGPPTRSVAEWLVRLQQASTTPSFAGTYVTSSSSGALSSARIWHLCEGKVQIERVDVLTGVPRSIFRRDDQVFTFVPDQRVMQVEQREPGGVFPNLLGPTGSTEAADHYRVQEYGQERVAGLEADVVEFSPNDKLRFGYRVWSERKTGLVLKTQTLDEGGRVLEQAAFSEVQLDPPAQGVRPYLQLPDTGGYRSRRIDRVKIDAADQGWVLRPVVAGFEPRACYRRAVTAATSGVQWVFSDGLATVSLFIEPFDARRHGREGVSASGATHAMSRRWPSAEGSWWITLVGEVPPQTLKLMVDNLERTK